MYTLRLLNWLDSFEAIFCSQGCMRRSYCITADYSINEVKNVLVARWNRWPSTMVLCMNWSAVDAVPQMSEKCHLYLAPPVTKRILIHYRTSSVPVEPVPLGTAIAPDVHEQCELTEFRRFDSQGQLGLDLNQKYVWYTFMGGTE